MISELVTARHLSRRAVVYIRQSHPHQVLSNQESLRLQYALEQRALGLGWRPEDIEIIDADLGLTGASAQHRQGFKEVVSRGTLGQIGIILSSEVTRLSRNCSDWYPLLDICGYKDCLIADGDGRRPVHFFTHFRVPSRRRTDRASARLDRWRRHFRHSRAHGEGWNASVGE